MIGGPVTVCELYRCRPSLPGIFWIEWRDCRNKPRDVTLINGDAPSLQKDFLGLGLLSGELRQDGFSMRGDLTVTDLGRELLERVDGDISSNVGRYT